MREFIVSPEIHKVFVEFRSELQDPRAKRILDESRQFLGISVEEVRVRDLYYLLARLDDRELQTAGKVLCDPVSTVGTVDSEPSTTGCDYRVVVRYKAGVTDNVGSTARQILQEVLDRKFSDTEAVVFARQILLFGVNRAEAKRISLELLHNELVEDAFLLAPGEVEPEPTLLGRRVRDFEPIVESVSLDGSPGELEKISSERMLALDVQEMGAIRDHFHNPIVSSSRQTLGLPQEPTDVELECLAQTWSEHCFHKVFQSRIHYTDHEGNSEKIDSLFATYIKGATEKIDADFVVSAFHDNAGIVRLHETFDLAYKIETHNSPSALDPYGGAMTGIVGVDRDILGAGLGCEPLAHVKGFCLGDPSLEGSLPGGLLHPQRVRDGVHLGVQEGGNQSGIPLLRGFEIFEPRYSGKPLVFCGTLGKIPRSVQGRDSFEKKINPGDYIVVVGGRVGKDGIHGATFSSLELTHDSPVQAVQIGDPITQKRVTDMLREARDQGMYRCITDNGAGGLSSSVGEMAKLTGGARIDLNQVPLKYPGLHPWEIFVSESQERMTLAIESQSLESFLHLCLNRGVEASCLGTFTDSGSLEIYFADLCVACLDMKFLHEGHPGLVLKGSFEMRSYPVPDLSQISPEEALLKLVGSLNLCSKETKLRQYDWEVKGLSAVKLLVGEKQDVIPDASVIQVDHDVLSGIALSESIHPTLSDLDPYAMAVLVVDEAVRKVIATGANLGEIAGVDNFCWPSVVNESLPDRSQKLGQLVRACQGLRDACVTLKVPLISGKDSMANDCTRVDPPISIPPTLLFSVMARIEDVSKCVTLDWKSASDSVFLVGQTKDELGASELYRTLGQRIEERPAIGISFPSVCLETNLSTYQAMQKAISAGVVRSCHALERGGLAMGVARACLASGLGLEIELAQVAAHSNLDSPWPLIFSESGGRFLVSVAPENLDQFHEFMKDSHVFELGTVREEPQLSISYCSEKVIHLAIDKLRAEFHKPLEEKR